MNDASVLEIGRKSVADGSKGINDGWGCSEPAYLSLFDETKLWWTTIGNWGETPT
jgi:hypothetical protein